jgi:uncharacterized membrane protein YeaQ/YmgE (transglycosylase-associated protein family)
VKGSGALKGAGQGLLASVITGMIGAFTSGPAYVALAASSNLLMVMALVTFAVIGAWNAPGILRHALERGEPERAYEDELRELYGPAPTGVTMAEVIAEWPQFITASQAGMSRLRYLGPPPTWTGPQERLVFETLPGTEFYPCQVDVAQGRDHDVYIQDSQVTCAGCGLVLEPSASGVYRCYGCWQ